MDFFPQSINLPHLRSTCTSLREKKLHVSESLASAFVTRACRDETVSARRAVACYKAVELRVTIWHYSTFKYLLKFQVKSFEPCRINLQCNKSKHFLNVALMLQPNIWVIHLSYYWSSALFHKINKTKSLAVLLRKWKFSVTTSSLSSQKIAITRRNPNFLKRSF